MSCPLLSSSLWPAKQLPHYKGQMFCQLARNAKTVIWTSGCILVQTDAFLCNGHRLREPNKSLLKPVIPVFVSARTHLYKWIALFLIKPVVEVSHQLNTYSSLGLRLLLGKYHHTAVFAVAELPSYFHNIPTVWLIVSTPWLHFQLGGKISWQDKM